MFSAIGAIRVVDGPWLIATFVVEILLLGLLAWPAPGVLVPARRHLTKVAIGAAAGALLGILATWLLSDVWNIFGLSLTYVVRWADALAFLAWGIAAVNLFGTRWWRKAVVLVSGALTLLCLGLVFNIDFGKFPTFADALGFSYTAELELPQPALSGTPIAGWEAPADLPDAGVVGKVTIPATVSGFPARDAYVYLPPAALVADPPDLPVLITLGGQPGEPADLFRAGRLDAILDDVAAAHRGLAPIVVAPDQLSDPSGNPLCIDGPFGASETYLTVDVPAWIRSSLNVTSDRTGWSIAGFSQGGTCSIQLAAGFPELFGSFVDVSGELAPSLGSPESTIERGFGGSETAYAAASPAALLRAGAPFADTAAIFVAGENDATYSATMRALAAQAASAGMSVTTDVSPGDGHDWNTARYGLQFGITRLLARWGIDG